MNTNTKLPAFFTPAPNQANDDKALRDYFAANALTGLLAHNASDTHSDKELATQAYHLADAMLAERDNP